MNNSKRLYLDVHVLQTVPPSCVNRDDTGSPKTAIYGGVTRARVSSQAWKRAMRLAFEDLFAREELGVRTKRIVGMTADEILLRNPAADAAKLAEEALKNAGLKIKSADKGTDALFFMSHRQAAALAEMSIRGEKDTKAYKKALEENPAVDIALFGRMVADDPSLNYDAAAQVAHSISTHAVQNEFDYYTAVDDKAPEDNAGAGHIGTAEFNSSTLYRYATVNVCELLESLGERETTIRAIKGFVDAFIHSMPTGRQNSFANRTLPELVYIAVREDQPVSFVGAFEKPVQAGENGYFTGSESSFVEYAKTTYAKFAPPPVLAVGVSRGTKLAEIAQEAPADQLPAQVGMFLTERIEVKA